MAAPDSNGHPPARPEDSASNAVEHLDRGLRLSQAASALLSGVIAVPALFFRLGSLATAMVVAAALAVLATLWSLRWAADPAHEPRARVESIAFPAVAAACVALVGPIALSTWSMVTVVLGLVAAVALFIVLVSLFTLRRKHLGGVRGAMTTVCVLVLVVCGAVVWTNRGKLVQELEAARAREDAQVLGEHHERPESPPSSTGTEPCNGAVGAGTPSPIKGAMLTAFLGASPPVSCPTEEPRFDRAAEAWRQPLPDGTLQARERGTDGKPEGSLVPKGVEEARATLDPIAPLGPGEFPSGPRACGPGEIHAYRTRSGEIRALVLRPDAGSPYYAIPSPMVAGSWWSVARRAQAIPFPKGPPKLLRGGMIEQAFGSLDPDALQVHRDHRSKGPTLGELLELCPPGEPAGARPNMPTIIVFSGEMTVVPACTPPEVQC
jgi:hypothetical protein